MTPDVVVTETVETDWGWLRFPAGSGVRVGDRWVPTPIDIDFPGAGGQPALTMKIEVIKGVPRCTHLQFSQAEAGREVREKDLRAVKLDEWVETFVAICSGRITNSDGTVTRIAYSRSESDIRAGIKEVSKARAGSRRQLTDEVKRKTAEVYNAHDKGGIAAVEAAFSVSRSTAIRYINAAKSEGLING